MLKGVCCLYRCCYVTGEGNQHGSATSASTLVKEAGCACRLVERGERAREKGMLHRTKYNRFRNESVTSVDELLHGLSMNPKVSATPQPAAETSYTPPTEVHPSSTTTASSTPTSHGSDHLEDGGTTLCTLINKVSNLKFSNSGSLLGIKGLPSAVKDLAVSKLQVGGGSGSGSGPSPSAATAAAAAASGVGGSLCSSASHSTPCSQLEPAVSMSKKSRLDELQPGREDWNPGGGGGLVSKPSRGWLHSSEKISGPGVTYIVKVGGLTVSPVSFPFFLPSPFFPFFSHSLVSFNDSSLATCKGRG